MTQPDTNLPPNDYDEIDLRDIFRILGKWKKTIVGVTILCMLLSAAYSVFILDPVYEARVLVTPAAINSLNRPANISYIIQDDRYRDSQAIFDNVDETIKMMQADVNQYKVVLTSDYVLQHVIDSLKLSTTPSALKGQVKVEDVKNSGMTEGAASEVIVQSANPQEAARIANCLVQQTAAYLNEMNRQKMSKLQDNLEEQQKIAKQELDQAYARLIQYQTQGGANELANKLEVNKLQTEVNLREAMVNSLSSKILHVKVLQSFESAEDKLVVLSAASVPVKPVQPNKTLNITIAGVLGLMISVFGVFLFEYLKEED